MATKTEKVAHALAHHLADSDFGGMIATRPDEANDYGRAAIGVVRAYESATEDGAYGNLLVAIIADPIARHVGWQSYHTMEGVVQDQYRLAAEAAIAAMGGARLLASSPPVQPRTDLKLSGDTDRFFWLLDQAGVSVELMVSPTRMPREVAARTAVAYCLRVWIVGSVELSYPRITDLMGRPSAAGKNRHSSHTTILTMCRRVYDRPRSAVLAHELLGAIEATGVGKIDHDMVRPAGYGRAVHVDVSDGVADHG